jgi:GNAT superfamily N-acetyltransferase
MWPLDLELSRRLERAEGDACRKFAEARARTVPGSSATWIEIAGAYAVFDGVDSPITQVFGLGIFEPLTPATLDKVEEFFFERGAPVDLEISPFAGVPAAQLLCSRGYRPVEISNVMYRPVEAPKTAPPPSIRVRVAGPAEAHVWNDVSTRGWSHEHPELRDFLLTFGKVNTAREGSLHFLAEFDGTPGAAGTLCLHEGVALFGGSATVPELRRRGLQSALLDERMRYAAEHGCNVAMIVVEVGSGSQRNAERNGFRVAYTRTKWRLDSGGEKRETRNEKLPA